jgi:hypothetical protein
MKRRQPSVSIIDHRRVVVAMVGKMPTLRDHVNSASISQRSYGELMIMTLMLAASIQVSACPGTIADKQIVSPQPGWEVKTDMFVRPLESVTVFSGHPRKLGSIMGQKLKSGQTKWGFNDPDVWVECRYSRSSAVLTRRIEGANFCVFTPQEDGTDDPASMKCDRKK